MNGGHQVQPTQNGTSLVTNDISISNAKNHPTQNEQNQSPFTKSAKKAVSKHDKEKMR